MLGLTVIEAGHYETEFPVCRVLRDLVVVAGERSGADIQAEIFDSHMARSF